MNLPVYIAYTSEVERRTVGSRPDVPVRVITCLKATLTQDMMPAGMDVVVYGDDVTLASPLRLPGSNVTIISRVVTLAPGASLDLSGAAGGPVGTARAADGKPGASAQQPDATDGVPGDRGNPGLDAGSFTLVAGSASGTLAVTARGGDGGKGQGGGNGGTGLDGADGAYFQVQQTQNSPNVVFSLVSDGQPGVHGGRAGIGGTGGPGGAAGSGGTVTVGVVSGPPPPSPATARPETRARAAIRGARKGRARAGRAGCWRSTPPWAERDRAFPATWIPAAMPRTARPARCPRHRASRGAAAPTGGRGPPRPCSSSPTSTAPTPLPAAPPAAAAPGGILLPGRRNGGGWLRGRGAAAALALPHHHAPQGAAPSPRPRR